MVVQGVRITGFPLYMYIHILRSLIKAQFEHNSVTVHELQVLLQCMIRGNEFCEVLNVLHIISSSNAYGLLVNGHCSAYKLVNISDVKGLTLLVVTCIWVYIAELQLTKKCVMDQSSFKSECLDQSFHRNLFSLRVCAIA